MERNFTCVPRKPICLEHELQTNSLEQSSWEADSRWASQEIPCHLWNLRVQCCVHYIPHWTLSCAIWILSTSSCHVYLILSSHLWICFMGDLFLLGFRSKILYSFLISPMDVACPAHFILLDLVTQIVLLWWNTG
jgi:hypothetical protein